MEDAKLSGEKYEETQNKLRMHNMSQQGGRAYLDSNNEPMEVPTPNVSSMQSQEPRWDDFEPKEGQGRPNSFNMEIRKGQEEEEMGRDRKALLQLTKQRLMALEDRRVDDRIAEEITRIMIKEAGDRNAEQMSSMTNFMYIAYELSWGVSQRWRRRSCMRSNSK